jgi:ATP-dependent Clp protease protease subunit
MASFILFGGEPTKHIAFPHARIMLHQLGSVYDRTPEFLLEVEELHKVYKMIIRVYVLRTDKPFWVVSKNMESDVFISADEAKAYGLVDNFFSKYLYILVSQNSTISNHLS